LKFQGVAFARISTVTEEIALLGIDHDMPLVALAGAHCAAPTVVN
jgi:hypothetical protein